MSEDKELNSILESASKSGSNEYRRGGRPSFHDDIDHEEEVENQLQKAYEQWTTHNGKIYVPAAKTRPKLVPGVYEIGQSPNIGTYFEKIPVKTEGLIRFPDSNSTKVVEEIFKFWNSEDRFRKYGLTYKRGILLWGPPGSGKSCTIQIIMADVIARQGVVIRFDDPYVFIDGMRILRTVQPETPVVVMMEDIDSIIAMHSESEVLNILDGVNEVERSVFLATTNYPERLGARIVNRPSRFDKRFKIGFPGAKARRMYFEHLFANAATTAAAEGVDLSQWVKDTKELSIAHLKELFIAVQIIGDEYKKALDTVQSMKENIDDKDENKFGFAGASSKDDPDE